MKFGEKTLVLERFLRSDGVCNVVGGKLAANVRAMKMQVGGIGRTELVVFVIGVRLRRQLVLEIDPQPFSSSEGESRPGETPIEQSRMECASHDGFVIRF